MIAHDDGTDSIDLGDADAAIDILNFSYTSPVGVAVGFTADEAGGYAFLGGGAASGSFAGVEQVNLTQNDDILDAGAAAAAVIAYGGAGNDTLTGGSGADALHGGAGSDVLGGGAGADSLWGDDDADTFLVFDGFGADTISGGETVTTGLDFDTIDLSAVTAPLGVTFTGAEAGTLTDGTHTIAFTGIERLILSAGADVVNGTASAAGIVVEAGGGADLLQGGAGDDSLDGGAGDDTLRGGAGDDTLLGGDGRDAIFVTDTGGTDTIDGGAGGDDWDTLWLDRESGPDGVTVSWVTGESGSYDFDGTAAAGSFTEIETIRGTEGADLFDGSASTGGIDADAQGGDDTLTGSDWNDRLIGGAGADTISGGAGHDTLDGQTGDDVLTGGAGNDLLLGGYGTDTLAGDGGDDWFVIGNASASVTTVTGGETGETTGDRLVLQGDGSVSPGVTVIYTGDEAGSFDDGTNSGTFSEIERLETQAGDDVIDASASTAGVWIAAGAGDDLLVAGTGDDTLTGGTGDDTFALADGGGANTIVDFDMADDDGDGRTNDQLDVSGLTDAQGNPVHASDVVVSDDGAGNAVLTFPDGTGVTLLGVGPAGLDPATLQSMGIPCFVAGTRIDTPEGPRAVETLRPGDRVSLAGGGALPVVWTGTRARDAAALAAAPGLRPVRIRAGALGNGRDLLLSPQHRVALGAPGAPEGFVPARWLAADGDGRFRVAEGRRAVCYVHVMLPRHALIRAEGAVVESFYPGPQALGALDIHARARLLLRFPALAGVRSRADAARAYGPLALPELPRAALARHLAPAGEALARAARAAGRRAAGA